MTPEMTPAGSSLKPADSTSESALADTGLNRPDAAVPASPPQIPGGAAHGWPGTSLGRYQIAGVLGQGGMGMVLKARDPLIERDVAIKVLPGDLAADASALGRFLAEARAAGKLTHPNVIAIHEVCQEGKIHYLVLEYVAGRSLADHVREGQPLSVLEATRALVDACKGVGAAHAAGFIHRDIKPANLMRAEDGSIKVTDFGLAKVAADTSLHLTQTGVVIGTPFFMSPEQCEAKPLDHRSDLYSLGATYYSLLTGKHPYHGTTGVTQLLYMHCHGPIPDARSVNPSIPEACSRIIARAMAKRPDERYQSAAGMLADLQAVLGTLSGQTRIALPSESGIASATRAAASERPAAAGRQRIRLAVAGCLFLALAAAIWPAWQKFRGNPSAANVASPAAAEPVKVGVLHSLSGTMATSETVVVDAVLFAIDEINQAGGVLGRTVKPVIADGRSNAQTFADEAEHLITEDRVCTVFGCWTSASRKTVKPVFEAHDHLLIYPVQFEGLEASPCIVYLGAAPNQQILPALQWALTSLQRKRFFLVGSDYVFPRAAHAIIKEYVQRNGGHVVGEEYVPLGSQKFEAVMSAIARVKPDMVLNTINGDSNVAFFRALRAVGVNAASVPTLSFSIDEQGLRSLNPANVAGDYAAWTYFQSVATPENEEFVRRFQEKHPRHRITDAMETAYLGVKLWALAVNDAQSLDPKKIRRALLNQRLKGPGGAVRIDPDTQYCFRTPRISQIQADGRFKVVWTAPEPIRPDPYPG